jgi:glutamyl-tRNA synthetase
VRGRLAPSPTGALHLGGAATFLVAWLDARSAGSRLVLRVEDLDLPRVVPGAEGGIVRDLRWLGLDWDEGPEEGGPVGPYRQSERGKGYDEALARLEAQGLLYGCDCSRSEIARAASAPHPGEEGPRYPGTCRSKGLRGPWRRPPALRFAVPEGREVRFVDAVHGEQREVVSERVGDFVLRRGDGVVAYQLAVVVDDLAMGIERVVRGADLLGSTARQILLMEALGGEAPSYLHTPLVLGPGGERLAKRSRGVPVADQREVGRSPEEVIGALAFLLGLRDAAEPCTASSLLPGYAPERLPREAVLLPGALHVLLGPPGVVGSDPRLANDGELHVPQMQAYHRREPDPVSPRWGRVGARPSAGAASLRRAAGAASPRAATPRAASPRAASPRAASSGAVSPRAEAIAAGEQQPGVPRAGGARAGADASGAAGARA